MKKIIISYDYELFFGDKSGTVEKTLIEPTDYILDSFRNTRLKANFFIDYLMIKKLKEIDDVYTRRDVESIEKQIQQMVKDGHRVELHIHSHWVNAKYLGEGLWDYSDFSHYSLSSFSENQIVEMFIEGCDILENIVQKVSPDYKIVAFRAGGWAIQPFYLFRKAFEETGIRIDSSSAAGIYSDNSYSTFDFRNAPHKTVYKFTNDVCKEETDGRFIEVSITSYNRRLIHKLLDHGYGKLHPNTMNRIADGTHIRKRDGNTGKSKSCARAMMTIAGRSWMTLILNIISTRDNIVTFIDHPKDFSFVAIKNINFLSRITHSILYKDLLDI